MGKKWEKGDWTTARRELLEKVGEKRPYGRQCKERKTTTTKNQEIGERLEPREGKGEKKQLRYNKRRNDLVINAQAWESELRSSFPISP